MGLDMWVFKLKRLSEEEIGENRYRGTKADIFWNVFCLSKTDFDENPEMFKDIMPFTTIESLLDSTCRYDLMKKDYSIPQSAQLVSISNRPCEMEFGFADNDAKYPPVCISHDRLEGYTEYHLRPYYLVHKEEIQYWRKEYGLQDKLYELYQKQYAIRKQIIDYLLNNFDINFSSIKPVSLDDKEIDKMIASLSLNMSKVGVKEIYNQLNKNGISFYLTDIADSIQNCGYHAMNRDMAKACGLFDEYKSLKNDEVLVYHEWY